MAIKPKTYLRPWENMPVDYNVPGQGRRHIGSQKFYKSPIWRKTRLVKLQMNPFCQCDECLMGHVSVRADMVDHHIPINPDDPYDTKNGRFGEPLDFDNLRSMYTPHHNRKSGKERHKKNDYGQK